MKNNLQTISAFVFAIAVFAIGSAAFSQRSQCTRTSAVQEIKMLCQATLQITK